MCLYYSHAQPTVSGIDLVGVVSRSRCKGRISVRAVLTRCFSMAGDVITKPDRVIKWANTSGTGIFLLLQAVEIPGVRSLETPRMMHLSHQIQSPFL